MLLINEAFAGAWTLVWHWGGGVAFVILCLLAAYFSPLYKKWFLSAAGIAVLCLASYGSGIADQALKEKEEQKVTIQYVDRVVIKAQTKKAQKRPDRWNRKDY